MWRRWGTHQNFILAFIDELWKTSKIRILKKWKKKLLEISFYTCVPKATIIWGTVPEIQSETNFLVILGHFLPFTPLPPLTRKPLFLKNEKTIWRCHYFKLVKQKNAIKWCMLTQIWSVTDTVILGQFFLFYPTTDPEN